MDHAEPAAHGMSCGEDAYSFADVPRLTGALKAGDEIAFAWLHRQWGARINRYCFALAAGDEPFSAEIAQEVWLRVVRHMRPLDDEPALWNWIACATRHSAIDLRRKGGRYRRALQRFAERWFQPANTTPHTESDVEESLRAALESALQKLSADDRALIDGRYFDGHSLETMASRHSLSVRAVEGRLARLRVRLRKLVAGEIQSHLP